MMQRIILLSCLLLITVQVKAQNVVDQKGTKRVADTTADGWKNDPANTQVKLAYKSDGSTARAAGTDFVIKDDGKVGIGTSTPGAMLHIKNGDFRLENENNWNAYKGVTYSNTQYPQLFLFQARGTKASPTYPISGTTIGVFRAANAIDSVGGAGFRVKSTQAQASGKYGTSMIIFTNANDAASNTDQFIVDQNGNVGIGNMSPTSKLSVTDTASTTYLQIADYFAPSNTTANNNTLFKMGVAATTNNSAEVRFNYQGNGLNTNRLDFSFHGTATPLMSVRADGNVGIGTTTPQKKLHVNGSLQVTNELNVGGNGTTAGDAGTAGQVLTSGGAGAAPAWKSVSAVTGTVATVYYVQGTTNASIAAGNTADVPGVTITHTVPTGATQTLLFTVSGYAILNTTGDGLAGQGSFLLLQGATKISSAYVSVGDGGSLNNLPHPAVMMKSVTLSAGTYVFKVQYKSWLGTQIVNNNPASSTGGNVNYGGADSGDTEAMLTKMQVLVYNN